MPCRADPTPGPPQRSAACCSRWPEKEMRPVVSLIFIFWMYVVLFCVIGGMRGWAKEMLVIFSVILALTLTTLLDRLRALRPRCPGQGQPCPVFLAARHHPVLLVFFGYQTPNITRFAPKMTREKFQDSMLGVFLGAVNGYLIAGTIWFYLQMQSILFPDHHAAPTAAIWQGGAKACSSICLPGCWAFLAFILPLSWRSSS